MKGVFSVLCKISLRLAMGILKRVLAQLKRRAEQSGTPLDDIAIQAVEEVIQVYEEGEISKLLCE